MSSLVKAKRPDYIYVGDPIKEEPELKATLILDIEKDIVDPPKPKDGRSRAKTVARNRTDRDYLVVSEEPKRYTRSRSTLKT